MTNDNKKTIKGYKGFNPDMTCRSFKYESGKEYETAEAKKCESGFHFCESPFDVWKYYPPCDNKGNINRFCEVEGSGDMDSDSDKIVCSRIRIGAELDLQGIIKAGVKFIMERAKNTVTNTGYCSAATNTGNRSAATNTGDWSAATNTGDWSAATNTGDWSATTNTGYCSAATNTGDRSAATNTGNHSAATNTGNHSAATNTGDWSAATNTGDCSAATNTGDCSAATNTGYCSAATVKGRNSIAIATGKSSKARGALGNWIVLTERDENYQIKQVKAFKVDGETIKHMTFYTLRDGEAVEVD